MKYDLYSPRTKLYYDNTQDSWFDLNSYCPHCDDEGFTSAILFDIPPIGEGHFMNVKAKCYCCNREGILHSEYPPQRPVGESVLRLVLQ